MNAQTKVTADHLRKHAILYVRQSTLHQVKENRETALQYNLKRHARELGWNVEQTVVIDEDLGESAATATEFLPHEIHECFEEGELRLPPEFATTPEERKAGFP
jgi:hypothetical protein